MADEKKTRPFHESIVPALDRVSNQIELDAIAALILETEISHGHDAIINAWTRAAYRIDSNLRPEDDRVLAHLRQQKAEAKAKAAAESEIRPKDLAELLTMGLHSAELGQPDMGFGFTPDDAFSWPLEPGDPYRLSDDVDRAMALGPEDQRLQDLINRGPDGAGFPDGLTARLIPLDFSLGRHLTLGLPPDHGNSFACESRDGEPPKDRAVAIDLGRPHQFGDVPVSSLRINGWDGNGEVTVMFDPRDPDPSELEKLGLDGLGSDGSDSDATAVFSPHDDDPTNKWKG